ncbi:hypothetical protein GCM10028784_08490 [Myceligenerans cantabricum]
MLAGSVLTTVLAVLVAGCGLGSDGPSDGFAAGDDFTYMAEVVTEGGARDFGFISGTITSDGQVDGEFQLAQIEDGQMSKSTTAFTGQVNDDGTASFRGIGPEGAGVDLTATLEDGQAVMTTDLEPGIAATTWNRASLPAFNNAIQDAVRQ